MRKIISKIAGTLLGLSLAVGVGVGLSFEKTASKANAGEETAELTVAVAHGNNTSASGEDSFTYGPLTVHTSSGGLNCSEYRFGKSSTTTISCSSGNISSIVFTCTAQNTTKYGPGCFGTGAPTGYTYSGYTGTWTGNSASVAFTATDNQVRASKIEVTYDDGQGDVTTYDVIDNVSNGSLNKSSVNEGATLSVLITADSGYYVPESVSVTMGGTSCAFTYSNSVVTVENVSGNVSISGSCIAIPAPIHAGTQVDPYTVADAIHAIDLNTGLSGVYATGKVSSIVTVYSSQHSNITFDISADGLTTGLQLRAYRCKGSSTYTIDSDDDIEVGATVTVYGTLVNYNGTREFSEGCTVVEYSLVKELSSISLSGEYPTAFEVGDTFSYSGLVVTAHYADSSERTVTDITVTSPDMSSTGQKTVTVSYTENDVTKSSSYSIQVNAVTTKWTVSFDSGEGSGTMASVKVSDGNSYTLPECTFTAPSGKTFDGWTINGTDKITSIASVTGNMTVTALWKAAPVETSISWEVKDSADVVTTGYSFEKVRGEFKNSTFYQDGSTDGLIVQVKSSNDSEWWGSTSPDTIKVTAKVGGGTVRDPLNNNVYAYFIDSNGDQIASSETIVTTKVEATDGKEYEVYMPATANVYGILFSHAKETSYNIRLYGMTLTYSYGASDVYTITYDGNGASNSMAPTVGTNPVVAANSFVREGYTFLRWNSQADGEGVDYAAGTEMSSSITLYAIWQEIVEPVGTDVQMGAGDNSGSATVVVGGVEKAAIKCGSGSKQGAMTITLKVANITKIKVYVGCWNGSSETTTVNVSISGSATVSPTSLSLVKDEGFTGSSSTFTLNGAETVYRQDLTISAGAPVDTVITITAKNASNNRFIVWGATNLFAETFSTSFLSDLTCDESGTSEPTYATDVSWISFQSLFGGLDSEEQSILRDAEYTVSGSGSSTVVTAKTGTDQTVAEAMARYDYIVAKYGTAKYTNFIGRSVTPIAGSPVVISNMNTNASTIIIVVVALTSITSIGVLLVIKRKRSLVK